MCDEYESFHDRTGKPVVGGQSSSSFVPSVIKTDVLLDSDDRAHKDLLSQIYGERIEKVSQRDKLSTFCMDAGFLNVVEIAQNFMTKDTAEFSQFTGAVACREYTPSKRRRSITTKRMDSHQVGKIGCWIRPVFVFISIRMSTHPASGGPGSVVIVIKYSVRSLSFCASSTCSPSKVTRAVDDHEHDRHNKQ